MSDSSIINFHSLSRGIDTDVFVKFQAHLQSSVIKKKSRLSS